MSALFAQGRVLAVADGHAEVAFAAASACGACRAQSVCGSGHGRVLHLPVADGVRAGDLLNLSMPEAEFNAGVLVGYLLPAVSTVLGAVLLSTFGDLAAAAGAAGGLFGGLRVARAWSRRWQAGTLGNGGASASPCLTKSPPGESS